jgi:hypothetical protein
MMKPLRGLLAFACALIVFVAQSRASEPPRTLRETGFFDASSHKLAFSPQYPLWSDGADKQRWIALPPGAAIDASNLDAWDFPRGTRLWKTFTHAGRPVETRLIEREADGAWRFAAYVWDDEGREAALTPARGAVLQVPAAPGGRYVVPGRGDCLACHGGAAAPVLGFAALQLSPDRDPNALHDRPRAIGELDLRALVERGWLRGLPPALLAVPPRIAAASAVERAALGTLHANCAHCHHSQAGRVPLRLMLAQRVADPEASAAEVLRSMVDAPSRWQPTQGGNARIVVPGDAAASVLLARMHSRDPRVQMPPLGTEHVDEQALALLTQWIRQDLNRTKEH